MLIGAWKETHKSDNIRKEALKELAYSTTAADKKQPNP
jgi:hypothetical protein